MKLLTTFILTLFFILPAFGQTKFDEYGAVSSDDESGRIDSMLSSLSDPDARGLIVVYSGADDKRIGNLKAHLNGIRQYIDDRPTYASRVTLMLVRGKEKFSKELWIAKRGEDFPKFDAFDANLNNLTKKFLYAQACLSCEPTVPALARDKIDYMELSKLLNNNKNYRLMVYLHKQDLPTAVEIRSALRKDYGPSAVNSIRLKLVKNYTPSASFYITPQ